MSERNPVRLSHQDTGHSPGEFVFSARLQAACRMLEDTSRMPNEIAGHFGVGSAVSLRRLLRNCLGVTPRQYCYRFRG